MSSIDSSNNVNNLININNSFHSNILNNEKDELLIKSIIDSDEDNNNENKKSSKRSDLLELSDNSKKMNKIAAKTRDLINDIETEEEEKLEEERRLEEIKSKVKSGFYQTDGAISDVIDKFLDEALFDITV